jgi:hypothetical protein
MAPAIPSGIEGEAEPLRILRSRRRSAYIWSRGLAGKFETFRIFSCLLKMQADFGLFGERLADACRARHMTVDIICQSAGLSGSQARLLPVIGVKALGVHELVQIPDTLGVSIDWLLGRGSVMEVPKVCN